MKLCRYALTVMAIVGVHVSLASAENCSPVTGSLCPNPVASDGFTTVEEYQDDFAQARECEPIDGRHVWAGKRAYYIQSWLFILLGGGDKSTQKADIAAAKALAKELKGVTR
jgi:hypothetical protein